MFANVCENDAGVRRLMVNLIVFQLIRCIVSSIRLGLQRTHLNCMTNC